MKRNGCKYSSGPSSSNSGPPTPQGFSPKDNRSKNQKPQIRCNVSSSSSSWNFNGRKSSHKTITESRDGVTRRVETTADVEFATGHVTQYLKQLTAEQREEIVDIRGRVRHVWVQKLRDNHLLDCELIIFAAAVGYEKV